MTRLRLARSENVGPITYRALMGRYGNAEAALAALPELSRKGGRARPLKPYAKAAAERESAAVAALGGRLITWGEPGYPALLAAIDDAPPVLCLRGNAHLLARPGVGMVGARNASAGGRRLARTLAAGLCEAGFVVVSGLARGVDAAAHEGALSVIAPSEATIAGATIAGATIAVVAGGVDVVYPPENAALHARIAAEGLVVSEMAPGVQPQARHFPRRNRIIAGLGYGVVVVEATRRSGSLITARLASEQGREVLAVPGSPLDPRSHGCNDLIRDGATLVQTVDDVIEPLRAMIGAPVREEPAPVYAAEPSGPPAEADLRSARRIVAGALSLAPVAVDEVVRQCQLSPALVQLIVLELELAGRAVRHPGSRVAAA